MGTERASLEKRHSILQSPSELHVKKKRNHNELLTQALLTLSADTPLLPFCGKKRKLQASWSTRPEPPKTKM